MFTLPIITAFLAGIVFTFLFAITAILISVANDERQKTNRRKAELAHDLETNYRKRLEFSTDKDKEEIAARAVDKYVRGEYPERGEVKETPFARAVRAGHPNPHQFGTGAREITVSEENKKLSKGEAMLGSGLKESREEAQVRFDSIHHPSCPNHPNNRVGGKNVRRPQIGVHVVEISGEELIKVITGKNESRTTTKKQSAAGKTKSKRNTAKTATSKTTRKPQAAKKGSRKTR